MTMDSLIPLVGLIGWLVLAGSALASYRLGWSRIARMALVWLAVFVGLFVMVEWFLRAQGAASALL
ncbi:hypothetical protein [Erythrobacter dokdonensis]|jgi:hypothetical protein|uniref:Uncharacterized protein n=1 Tax=Erythrobacter dokdonensis DSW-74 TaxID=1300349 RepID=A0A1A7BJD5_9SPHN|nr:hypothetical protein [Erythrobacter dokdonensis]MEE4315525.1 hypothetical protein [Erythrobacter sp.]OBV12584.1 hypothetical protein I603_0715 [Erythrobacter dokdonensis DSW-74]